MSHTHQGPGERPSYIKHQAYSCPQWELIGLHVASKEEPDHDEIYITYEKQAIHVLTCLLTGEIETWHLFLQTINHETVTIP